MRKKTIIYGNRSLSKMLYLDALDSKEIEIIAFVVDEAYLEPSGFFSNCPQVSFEKVEQIYPPQDYSMIVLEGTLRELDSVSLYTKAKAKGYTLLNYFSPRAIIAESFSCGDNNVIFEMAYVGHHGKMGSNNILRQQVYCGHDFNIEDNVIMNPGVKVGGFCHIESDVFIGMGATVINDLHLEKGCLIGAGSVCIRSTLPYTKNIGCPTQVTGTRYKQKEIPYV